MKNTDKIAKLILKANFGVDYKIADAYNELIKKVEDCLTDIHRYLNLTAQQDVPEIKVINIRFDSGRGSNIFVASTAKGFEEDPDVVLACQKLAKSYGFIFRSKNEMLQISKQ